MDTKHTEDKESDSSIPLHNINEDNPLLSEEPDMLSINQSTSTVPFPSCRLMLIFMGFLGFINMFCLRVGPSVALVAMLNHTQLKSYSENTSEDICSSNGTLMPTGTTTFVKEDTEGGEFNWDSHTQGAVLAAFFYGYITTQV